jgi:hypothetical protein
VPTVLRITVSGFAYRTVKRKIAGKNNCHTIFNVAKLNVETGILEKKIFLQTYPISAMQEQAG